MSDAKAGRLLNEGCYEPCIAAAIHEKLLYGI